MNKKMTFALSMAAALTTTAIVSEYEVQAKQTVYTVVKGDTVYKIGQKFNVSTTNIINWNNIKNNNIQVGQKIYLVNPYYTVQKGDTLYRVATNNGITTSQLKKINGLTSDTIKVGQKLTVVDGIEKTNTTTQNTTTEKNSTTTQSVGNTSQATTTYTVKSGDTLYKVAKTYDMTTKELKSLNNLSSDTVFVGQKLKVFAPKTSALNTQEKETVVKENAKNYVEMKVEASAYTANCTGCSGITATGINLKKNPNAKVISVDPSVIPLGSKVWVQGYGDAVAGDKGSAIKGKKIDVFYSNLSDALQWGRKTVTIKVYK